ncbi:gluconate 2-dehydrogenase subunit 3 family protein [Flectobacillus roseus]|uniref:Gluconate 2-dehydrogenase subunit 3 family protein n=1 Tax=Flectobacillus roseus TaxID=502259 RepID=A0ABT6YES1_9BACT|nr:gluconate 2-dehydrogenase subunit 3 family protein [Flectobacillus roseus]MDI9862096.1 gluconate 2-dehydrogenase subunit 3 family protein [Flectobacillus roseus]
MNRRDALSKVALLIGGTLSAPTLLAMSRAGEAKNTSMALGSFSLNDTQRKIVAEVAEHIIPRTSTPGAKDAGVPAFIEMMLNDCYKAPEHKSFLAGVSDLEKKNFLAQSKDQQIATLKQLESDTKELMKQYNVKQVKVGDNVDKETMDDASTGVPFWRLMKELTLTGYYTSEQGLKASFVYEPIPGKFESIKLKPGQKAFAY